MRTLHEALSGGEQGPRRQWIGHQAMPLLAALLLLTVACEIPDRWLLRWLLGELSLLLTFGVFWQGLRHDARLCERCVRRWPLDGSELAQRRRRVLRLFHLLGDPAPWSWWSKVFPPAVNPVVVALVAIDLGYPWLLPSNTLAWRVASDVPVLLAALVFLRTRHTHSVLMPWCPQCRHGGGGIIEPSPNPVIPEPAPAGAV